MNPTHLAGSPETYTDKHRDHEKLKKIILKNKEKLKHLYDPFP
ncbi:hypothetical protein NHE_0139 [Neorickettsia helminthoeca str. Oregon]|uniref:Uncharacterized protein n=1 Tax=Neorickettsia helminthoeca str. Oregon TaxID=1286528 RepID=X5GVM9_9RICK|nr:hypothetical protein NHE_0139 [Neorickettsia helminthoeca str. Oregon]